jgi:hypothetical protein
MQVEEFLLNYLTQNIPKIPSNKVDCIRKYHLPSKFSLLYAK